MLEAGYRALEPPSPEGARRKSRVSGEEPREVGGICEAERVRDDAHRIVGIEQLPLGFEHDPRMDQLDGRLPGHREAGITQARLGHVQHSGVGRQGRTVAIAAFDQFAKARDQPALLPNDRIRRIRALLGQTQHIGEQHFQPALQGQAVSGRGARKFARQHAKRLREIRRAQRLRLKLQRRWRREQSADLRLMAHQLVLQLNGYGGDIAGGTRFELKAVHGPGRHEHQRRRPELRSGALGLRDTAATRHENHLMQHLVQMRINPPMMPCTARLDGFHMQQWSGNAAWRLAVEEVRRDVLQGGTLDHGQM
jgi:hypothetical protein